MVMQARSATSQTPSTASSSGQPIAAYQPDVDVCDLGAEVLFIADLPGARADGIDVTFDDGVLSVQAAVPARALPGRGVQQEYGIGNYRRAFRLGEGFDASLIAADYKQGVLTIRVPRLAAVRPRKVDVKVS
ncbi:MAG: Hsp20/alpha crystallin family protein [Pirellulales bacterium]